MAIRDLLEKLGLDPELIKRDREMSAGLANAHEAHSQDLPDAGQRFVPVMASATEYRRAGAHSVLLSDREAATKMFRRAARMYGSLRKPYAVMMFSCADGDLGSIMASTHDFALAKEIERTQLPYLLLASAAGPEDRDREEYEKIRSDLEASQNAPVGVLGIPIGAYLDLAGALAQGEPGPRRLVEALLPFLVPFSSAIRRCMEDTYHWEMLAFPFHPAEPDILGVLFCVESTLRWRQQGSLLEMIRDMPLGEASTSLLYNAILERFEGRET
jgi:hypothetical protein